MEIEGRWEPYEDTPPPAAENRAAVRGGTPVHARRRARRCGPERRVRCDRAERRIHDRRDVGVRCVPCALTDYVLARPPRRRRRRTCARRPLRPRPAPRSSPSSAAEHAARARTHRRPGRPAAPSAVRRTTTSASVGAISCRDRLSTSAPMTGELRRDARPPVGTLGRDLHDVAVTRAVAPRSDAGSRRWGRPSSNSRRASAIARPMSRTLRQAAAVAAVRLAAMRVPAASQHDSSDPFGDRARRRVLHADDGHGALDAVDAWSRTSARSSSAGGWPSRTPCRHDAAMHERDVVEAERQPRKRRS